MNGEAEPQEASLFCTKCQQELPLFLFRSDQFRPCPSCGVEMYAVTFPALTRSTDTSRPGEALLIESDASCFYHPQKKAEMSCDYCGRFLCALCDVELERKHLCPPCIESGKLKGRLKSLENRRILYDSIAMSVAILPILVFYVTFITAPVALYMAIRYWNAPRSILHRNKWRLIVAIIFASLQIAAWGAGVYFLISRWT